MLRSALALLFICVSAPASLAADATSSYKADMKKMHRAMQMHYSGDVDSDFARGMIPHHQGALDMARTQQTYGNDEFISMIVDNIALSQMEEIGSMSRWLDRIGKAEPSADADTPETLAFKTAMRQMHHDMNIAYSGNADLDFVCGMIPHHEGAIAMAKIEMEHGGNPEMLRLSKNIILAQQSDIALMKSWLKDHNYTCHLADSHMHMNHS